MNVPNGVSLIIHLLNVRCTNDSHTTHTCRWVSVLLYLSWSIGIFLANFRAVSFYPLHPVVDADESVLVIHCVGEARSLVYWYLILILILVCQSSHHHVSLLRTWTHDYVIFLDYSNSTVLTTFALGLLLARSSVVLLGVHHTASHHLRILDLDRRIVENVVVVVNVLDNLDWLLLVFLLRL